MNRYVAPGQDSTEYRKALRAEVMGFALVAFGLAACVIAIYLASSIECYVGVGLSFSGAYLLAHSSHGYSAARGAVKASASAPAVEVSNRRI